MSVIITNCMIIGMIIYNIFVMWSHMYQIYQAENPPEKRAPGKEAHWSENRYWRGLWVFIQLILMFVFSFYFVQYIGPYLPREGWLEEWLVAVVQNYTGWAYSFPQK